MGDGEVGRAGRRGGAGRRPGGRRRGPRPGSGELPLAFDAVTEGYLDGLARLARHDPAARNALYRRFEPFCERVAGRLAARHWVQLAELDDVRHEGFLVFCDLVDDWPERGSFAGYVFAHFEPRLQRALRRFEGERRPARSQRPAGGRGRPALAGSDLEAAELLAALRPADRALVELLAAGYRLREVADRLGVATRTVRRRLRRLRAALAEWAPRRATGTLPGREAREGGAG